MMTDTAPAATVSPQRISQLAWGYAAPLIIEAALRNLVFEILDHSSSTVEEVHAATGTSTRGLTAIMDALCGMELLTKDRFGRYSLTPESDAFLVRGRPAFMGGLILHTSEQLLPKWLQITQVVRTGKPAVAVNQEGPGSAFFEQFVSDIFPMSYPSAQALAAALHLEQGRILDLAAGSGVWGIALAQSSPGVRVSAVDWPSVLPITEKTVARFHLEDRFNFIPGDLLSAEFGSDYDVATLGHILHSEGKARSRELLRKTYEALAQGGTIAIAEFLVNEQHTGPVVGLFFAVNMLINTDEGSTYSFEEIGDWLVDAGFVNPHILEVPGPSPLILAMKP